MMYLLGCIKWFDVYKGFGTVISTKGEEFFLHSSNLNYNGFIPEVGAPIIFEGKCVNDKKKAFNARIPKSLNDFTFLIKYISEGTQVKFEEKSTHRGRKGKLITNHYNRVFDVAESGTLNVMKGLKKNEVVKIFQDHFLDYVHNTNDREVIVNYYRLSKSTIKNLRFYFFQEHCKGTMVDAKDRIVTEVRLGEKIENEIIIFYNKHLSKEYKFWLWKNGLYENKPSYKRIEDIFNDNFVSGPLPIDDDTLIDNIGELNQSDFARLVQYDGVDSIILKLLDLKIQDSLGKTDKIKETIEIILICKNFEIHELEVRLIANLTDDMVYLLWSSKSFYIDFENNQFLRYTYGKDYIIPNEILLKNYKYLDEHQIKRIGTLPDSSEVIAKILLLKLSIDREDFIFNEDVLSILRLAEYII